MAGHSKWANIQHRKGRQDEKRGKAWTRVIREIMVAARLGGGDPTANPRLRLAIEKAKAVNLPVDTVKRNIDKATGNLEGVHYEEIRYEGYGIGGAAIIVDCMTDNRVRTVAEVRHAFSKYGGNMGTEGSVAFQFKHCGQLVFAPGTSEDKVMEVALEAGAEDVVTGDDGSIEVLCAPADFEAVKNALEGRRPEARDRRGDDARREPDRAGRRRRRSECRSCWTCSKTSTTCRTCSTTPCTTPEHRLRMKVLVIGGGGREHALAWKLAQSANGCRPCLRGAGQRRHRADPNAAQRAAHRPGRAGRLRGAPRRSRSPWSAPRRRWPPAWWTCSAPAACASSAPPARPRSWKAPRPSQGLHAAPRHSHRRVRRPSPTPPQAHAYVDAGRAHRRQGRRPGRRQGRGGGADLAEKRTPPSTTCWATTRWACSTTPTARAW